MANRKTAKKKRLKERKKWREEEQSDSPNTRM